MKYMTYSIYKQGIIRGGFNPSAHCDGKERNPSGFVTEHCHVLRPFATNGSPSSPSTFCSTASPLTTIVGPPTTSSLTSPLSPITPLHAFNARYCVPAIGGIPLYGHPNTTVVGKIGLEWDDEEPPLGHPMPFNATTGREYFSGESNTAYSGSRFRSDLQ